MSSFVIVKPGHEGKVKEPDEGPFALEAADFRCLPARAMCLHLCACGALTVLSHLSSCKIEGFNNQLYWTLQKRLRALFETYGSELGLAEEDKPPMIVLDPLVYPLAEAWEASAKKKHWKFPNGGQNVAYVEFLVVSQESMLFRGAVTHWMAYKGNVLVPLSDQHRVLPDKGSMAPAPKQPPVLRSMPRGVGWVPTWLYVVMARKNQYARLGLEFHLLKQGCAPCSSLGGAAATWVTTQGLADRELPLWKASPEEKKAVPHPSSGDKMKPWVAVSETLAFLCYQEDRAHAGDEDYVPFLPPGVGTKAVAAYITRLEKMADDGEALMERIKAAEEAIDVDRPGAKAPPPAEEFDSSMFLSFPVTPKKEKMDEEDATDAQVGQKEGATEVKDPPSKNLRVTKPRKDAPMVVEILREGLEEEPRDEKKILQELMDCGCPADYAKDLLRDALEKEKKAQKASKSKRKAAAASKARGAKKSKAAADSSEEEETSQGSGSPSSTASPISKGSPPKGAGTSPSGDSKGSKGSDSTFVQGPK